ncbi:PucR family transcriptional regulator [Paenibacillus sp. SYP-B3998]|uniref:PucR family transcriptional regulator n=1 Tax=Paenibacillus sp. SYP-B3998 TaxID=2678564 RepID=A0A6G3ZZ41_9BACL|nr:PucR family transcriptional regulator [Paenibacillus sp. SYP-B3998]NEW07402.1 PucR family transcriptional regulator [Paenibacillus sp. SYP-B3998]
MENTPFTVTSLLQIPLFRGAEVIGGKNGLSNEILYVDNMEMPDLTGWLRPNELILTTGYSFRHEPSMLGRLLDEMHRVGGSAVGIKTKRFLHEVPSEAVQKSNLYNIPLFDIPLDIPFMDMTHSIMDHILQRQAYMLREVQEVNQQFTNMVLNRHFAELVVLIGKLLVCEVAVLNRDGDMESSTSSFHPKNTVETREVRVGNRIWGSLAITRELADSEHFERMCLEHAVMVLGIEFTIRQSQQLHRTREQELFLVELLSGTRQQENLLHYRAQQLGMPSGKYLYVIAIEAFGSMEITSEEATRLYTSLTDTINQHGNHARQAVAINGCLLILCTTNSEEQSSLQRVIESYVKELNQQAEELVADVTLKCGVGATRERWVDLHASCVEAQKALALGGQSLPKRTVVHFHDIWVEHFLLDVSDHPVLAQLYQELIEPLARYDLEAGTNLLSTLESFLRMGNTKQVAEEMFIHRNSVLYRLERVTEILQTNIHDAETRFRLDLAIRYGKARQMKQTHFLQEKEEDYK